MTIDQTLVDGLVSAAIDAGAAILAVYATDFDVAAKGDASPVTLADQQAEAVILAWLADLMPGVPVVAEESASEGHVPADLGDRFVLVDPLDGTKEFISRNGEFTVNIAIVEAGRPVAGVVLVPALAIVYAGIVGVGAAVATVEAGRAVNWRPIIASLAPAAGYRVLASRSHAGPDTEAFLARLDVAERVAAGSSLKFCRLAEGAADLYPRLGRTMEWDTAAGDAILRAAGGHVVTLDGAPLDYGKRNQADDVDFANPWFVAVGAFDPAAVLG